MKVYPTMLLKTKIKKNGSLEYPTMFMITNDLFLICHDVYEK